MAVDSIADIRNIALVGHGGTGKTSLGEAILHKTGVTTRLGSVADKTSHLDFTDEEKEKGCSVESSLCFTQYGGKHFNIVVTPGAPDFCGQAIASLAAVETAVVVVSAMAGIEVNTRKMMERAREYGIARMMVINKIDGENVNLEELVELLQQSFGPECLPLNLPASGAKGVIDCFKNKTGDSDFGSVADAHTAIIEAIVSVDDSLMEQYLGGELDESNLGQVAAKAVAAGVFVPIVFTNARGEVGITEFLDAAVTFAPSPLEGKRRQLVAEAGVREIAPDPAGPLVGQVFRIGGDPKSNIKYSAIRIHSGTLTSDTHFHAGSEHKPLRPGQLHRMSGASYPDESRVVAGDIVALAKLDLKTGDVIHDSRETVSIEMPKFPAPMYSLAIEPKSRGDADKISGALHRFIEEDPCFKVDREGGELVIHGVGDQQVRLILTKMAKYYKLEVDTRPPRIPYRETVTATAANIEYTHKKQTGGAGQYGKVVITVEPNERGAGYEFVDDIFGGAIDQQFRPSVNKGVKAQMEEGVLAGYPIVDVKVRLIDGKTHPVDSKDIAFQIAGRGAFKEGFMKAKPILLEPIVQIEVTVPGENVGDIQGDLASRRGRPVGQDMLPGNFAMIKAIVPLAEVADYHSRLSSITGGQGSYAMEFSHYETVPSNVQQQIIAAAKKPEP